MLMTSQPGRCEPRRLRTGREARALDHHDGPAIVERDRQLAARARSRPRASSGSRGPRTRCASSPDRRRTCSAGRSCDRPAGRRSTKSPGFTVGCSEPHAFGPSTRVDAELLHGPDVRPVRDAMRRELVLQAVPRDERDPPAADVADHGRRRRFAVRRVDVDGLGRLQEGSRTPTRRTPRSPRRSRVPSSRPSSTSRTSRHRSSTRPSSQRASTSSFLSFFSPLESEDSFEAAGFSPDFSPFFSPDDFDFFP